MILQCSGVFLEKMSEETCPSHKAGALLEVE